MDSMQVPRGTLILRNVPQKIYILLAFELLFVITVLGIEQRWRSFREDGANTPHVKAEHPGYGSHGRAFVPIPQPKHLLMAWIFLGHALELAPSQPSWLEH